MCKHWLGFVVEWVWLFLILSTVSVAEVAKERRGKGDQVVVGTFTGVDVHTVDNREEAAWVDVRVSGGERDREGARRNAIASGHAFGRIATIAAE